MNYQPDDDDFDLIDRSLTMRAKGISEQHSSWRHWLQRKTLSRD